MNCDQVRESLDDFCAAELDSATQQQVVEHLAQCVACRDEWNIRSRWDEALRATLTVSESAVGRAVEQVSQRLPTVAQLEPGSLPATEELRRGRPRWQPIALAALAVAGVLFFALHGPWMAPTPSPSGQGKSLGSIATAIGAIEYRTTTTDEWRPLSIRSAHEFREPTTWRSGQNSCANY